MFSACIMRPVVVRAGLLGMRVNIVRLALLETIDLLAKTLIPCCTYLKATTPTWSLRHGCAFHSTSRYVFASWLSSSGTDGDHSVLGCVRPTFVACCRNPMQELGRQCEFFTMMRHPIDRLVSAFYYCPHINDKQERPRKVGCNLVRWHPGRTAQ